MLEKLAELETLFISFKTKEYWIEPTQFKVLDDLEYRNRIRALDITNDSYADYILSLNNTSNKLILLSQSLLNKASEVNQHYLTTKRSRQFSELVHRFVYLMKDYIVFCSRLMLSNNEECSALREMTMDDDNFVYNKNIKWLGGQTGPDPFNFNDTLTDDKYQTFWNLMDNINAICGIGEICTIDKCLNQTNVTQEEYEMLETSLNAHCSVCKLACVKTPEINFEIGIETLIETPTQDIVYSTGLTISVIFLILTLAVFVSIPKLRCTVQGKCTMFHVSSMIIAYTCLILAQYLYNVSQTACSVNGHIMQYAFLAMFFWLNVMCFDIMLALRVLKKQTRRESGKMKKLILYSCYGWGGPLIISVVTIILEYSDILHFSSDFKPYIGGPKCFLIGEVQVWLYIYGPIGMMIGANIIMFLMTAVFIYMHSKRTDIIRSENISTNRSNSHRLKVYVNLFILMGVNWFMEILSWRLPLNEYIFYLTDIVTTLQGVFVFVLFVCKKCVFDDLKQQFRKKSRRNTGNVNNGYQLAATN